MRSLFYFLLTLTLILITGCTKPQITTMKTKEYVEHNLEKLAPVALDCDLSDLNENDKQVLVKLVKASQIIDQLFLIQVNPYNPYLLAELDNKPDSEQHVELFKVMFGPWNRLEEDEAFINDTPKPKGAGFYPSDMTKEEFEKAIAENPELESDFTNTFTILHRHGGQLTSHPYHEVYKPFVTEIAKLLNEAAELTTDETLKSYLSLRARDFLTDDYFDSDMAWMDLAGKFEVVIGPYEVYEDNLFNYKAAYEAFICLVDHEESEKLAKVSGYLNEMEDHLPIPDKYKNFNRGSSSPIKVVQEVFAAGDTKAGIQTTAFNLPNDERVREAKGSKKVMLKNIARAKYDKCWIPIVNTILAEKPLANVSFDSYFNHVLMHEMSHGLGPGNITLSDGTKTSVAKELRELYSTIEECKADVLGVWNMQFMMQKGVFDKKNEYSLYASYLGGMFRSIRFGIGEAHGGGVAIQFNYLMEQGAVYVDDNGKLNINEKKVLPALESLATKVLMIQAHGDYDAAKALVDKYKNMTPVMEKFVNELKDVPIDIRPSFPVLGELGI